MEVNRTDSFPSVGIPWPMKEKKTDFFWQLANVVWACALKTFLLS
jgi:hypothetical protein